MGQRKKNSESSWGIKPQTFRFWSEAQFLMGTQNFFLCPKLVTRPKTSFSISFPSPKLTIPLILCTSSKKIKRKFMLTNLNLAFSYFSILIFYDIFTAIWCRFVVTWTTVLGIAFLLLNKLKEKHINVFSWIVTTTSPWSFFVTFRGIILWEK